MADRVLRVCALYPDLMNIYADRGNLLLLRRRCEWRGIGFELAGAGLGEPVDADAHDLFYLGGGQDRDQELCARDLVSSKRDALAAAVERGAVLFGVCGGFQLLGHGYQLGEERLPGLGLVDLETVREDGPRLIGNVAIEVDLEPATRVAGSDPSLHATPMAGSDPSLHATPVAGSDPPLHATPVAGSDPRVGGDGVLAGFENHGGRTRLGPGARPLGRVLRGHGNDGASGFEGVRGGPRDTVVGTYLHGPLLPKNAWFADWLTATALAIAPGELGALDDTLEDAAHAAARRAAGV